MRLPGLNNKSFAYRLISFVLVVMILVYSLIAIVTRRVVSDMMIQNTREYLETLVNARVSEYDGKLLSIAAQGRTLASILEDRLLSVDKLNSHLASILNENPDIVSICVAPAPGLDTGIEAGIYMKDENLKLVFNPILPKTYEFRDWYQIAVLKAKPHWGEPWFDEVGIKDLVCSYSLPMSRNGQILGVLRMDTLVKNMQAIKIPDRLRQGAYAFIISNTGTMITHPADSLLMNYSIFNLAEEYDDTALMTIGKNMIRGESELVKVSGISFFQDQRIYYAPLPSNGWSIAIVVQDSYIFADRQKLLAIILAFSVLGFLIIALVIYLRTLQIHRPLKEITKAAALIGGGDFDVPLSDPGGIYEIEQLTQGIEAMKLSLKQFIANLSELTIEKEKIQNEVLFASAVQRSLIPDNSTAKKICPGINCHGILKPAGAIGGDLYDFFMIDEHHFCFAIADVVGKGIVAAMTMTMVTTFLRTVSKHQKKPAEMLYSLNSFLSGNELESNLITIMLGIIDMKDGRLLFSNCGHVPWFHRKPDRRLIIHDETHSTALGVFPDITIDDEILLLEPGDQLILMTDGITEATDEAGEFFGHKGVEAALGELQHPSPDVSAITLLTAVEAFSSGDGSRDDITILALQFEHPHQID